MRALAALVALALLAGCATHAPEPVRTPKPTRTRMPSLEPVGEFALPDEAPEGLSAIAWMGGDRYAMAEDSGGRIHFARIGIDESTGAITNCVFWKTTTLDGLADAEGIAYDPSSRSLYVSDESGPKILLLRDTGDPLSVNYPEFFRQARGNKSLEALSLEVREGRPVIWAANEDALRCDGPVSSATNSALVRISAFQPFETDEDTSSWWFYPLDKAAGNPVPGLQRATPFNGLSGIEAIGRGRILALERSCGLLQGEQGEGALIAIGIYFVDVSGAKKGLEVGKTLLFRKSFDRSNYEGLTLGPALADGSRAVLLVADGDVMKTRIAGHEVAFPWRKALFALRLRE